LPAKRKNSVSLPLFHVKQGVCANIYYKIVKNVPKSLTYRDNNGIIVYRSELSAAKSAKSVRRRKKGG